MNAQIIFEDILNNAKKVYNKMETGRGCITNHMLPDYVYGELSEKDCKNMTDHIQKCESCIIEVLKLEVDKTKWELRIKSDPDAALADLLGTKGLAQITFSEIKEKFITFISDLWEPMWAGEPVTASDIPEQEHAFGMDQGEYINISCYWQGDDGGMPPYIKVSWNANIMAYSNLWARFVNPETNEILYESCLGTDLEGETIFRHEELGFDPSTQRWAISVITEAVQ